MAISARLPFAARRFELRQFSIVVRGLDLTGVALGMQVRLTEDVGGAPILQLNTVTTAATEGLKLESVETVEGVPVSTITGRINKSTMSNAAGLARIGEPGVPSRFAYAIRFGEISRLVGDFWAIPGTYDADTANPSGAYAGGQNSAPNPWSSAALTIAEQDVVEVMMDGAELIGPLVAAAQGFAEDSEGNAALAGRYANDDTDTDFVGGDPGDRGAKY